MYIIHRDGDLHKMFFTKLQQYFSGNFCGLLLEPCAGCVLFCRTACDIV